MLHHQYIINDKYVIQDRDLFNSLISGLVPTGAIFGALIAGPLTQYGRRFALISTSCVYIFFCIVSTVFDFYALVASRFMMGLCVGAYATISPLMISEVVPKSLSGPLGVMTQFLAVTGIVFALALSFMVPYSGTEAADTTQTWRLIFGFPGTVISVQLALLLFVFKYDTPKYYNDKNDKENHDNIMSCIYSDYSWTSNCSDDSELQSEVPVVEAKTHHQSNTNMKALAVGVLLSIFHQTTGISSVTFYSNEIFSAGQSGQEAELTARVGTFCTGIVAVIAAGAAIPISKSFGRKSILLVGEIIMCGLLGLLFWASLNENIFMVKVLTIVFVFTFNSSFGVVLWPYASEILNSKGVTLVASVNMLATLIFGC